MPLSLSERLAVTQELAQQYRRASKRERSALITQLQTLCGYHRSYAGRALRTAATRRDSPKRRPPKPGRGRKPTYGPAAKQALVQCWAILNFPTGKRLQPFLPELVARLEHHGELTLDPVAREQLLAMSAASIDRFLPPNGGG